MHVNGPTVVLGILWVVDIEMKIGLPVSNFIHLVLELLNVVCCNFTVTDRCSL